jgi:hypothetical protein
MSTSISEPRPIDILEGVEPSTDSTGFHTKHWTACDKIRFVNGRPRKIRGNTAITFDNSDTVTGLCRSIFSASVNGKVYTVLGTHQKLYSAIGTELINITPLKTATTTIANSLDNDYDTLGSNPATTVSGSKTVTITDTGAGVKYEAGDTYTLSGFSGAQNGIPDTELNAAHILRSVSTNSVTIAVPTTAATSSGATGGSSVVRATGLIQAAATAHGQANGDRVLIAAASATGGVTADQINIEHIVRNKGTNTFDFMTAGTATSSVSSGGGGSTTYQVEITDGAENEGFGQGYGAGKYGVGKYGTSKISSSNRVFPQIWFNDRFGEIILGTPGEQGGLYQWDGDTSTAPVLVTNAPAAMNYMFISNNIIVCLGTGDVENRIQTSDINGLTTWAATAENQVFQDDVEGAGRFISQVNVKGLNLLFTENQTWTFRYIGKPAVWEIKELDLSVGIIAPNARKEVNGIAFWMGSDNFYMWRGGNVEIIPSNSSMQSTMLNYVFDNLNYSQKSKIFVEYIERFKELRFHYPSSSSNECDRVVCVSLLSFAWWPDTIDRTAAEYPHTPLTLHRMVDSSGVLYNHETGYNNNGSAQTFTLSSPRRFSGKNTAQITGLIPDSVQTGNITVTLNTYRYPQSGTAIGTQAMTVTPTTEIIPAAKVGRIWEWAITGSTLAQNFIMGDWQDEIQKSSPQ